MAMCACSPEGQLYPGLEQKKHGQLVKGGTSATPLCSCATLPGSLCSALQPTEQEGHGPVGAGPEEGHENNQKAGMPHL